MPRHPKPAPLRANTERLDVGILAVQGELPEPPPPPPGLSKTMREAWDAYWRSPLARLVSMETDLLSLRRLWTLYEEKERSMRAYRRKREVKGSTGQTRVNPVVDAVSNADILALEDRYGLNPRARLTLGIIFGDAARSLADLNDELGTDDDAPDPRLLVPLDGDEGRVPASAIPVTPEETA